jgi:RecA/RadA recombinase
MPHCCLTCLCIHILGVIVFDVFSSLLLTGQLQRAGSDTGERAQRRARTMATHLREMMQKVQRNNSVVEVETEPRMKDREGGNGASKERAWLKVHCASIGCLLV